MSIDFKMFPYAWPAVIEALQQTAPDTTVKLRVQAAGQGTFHPLVAGPDDRLVQSRSRLLFEPITFQLQGETDRRGLARSAATRRSTT